MNLPIKATTLVKDNNDFKFKNKTLLLKVIDKSGHDNYYGFRTLSIRLCVSILILRHIHNQSQK